MDATTVTLLNSLSPLLQTTQILCGIMNFSFGVVFLFTLVNPYPRFPFIFISGYPFWGSALVSTVHLVQFKGISTRQGVSYEARQTWVYNSVEDATKALITPLQLLLSSFESPELMVAHLWVLKF